MAIVWLLLLWLAHRSIGRAPAPEGNFFTAYRLNTASLVAGILTAVFSGVPAIIGINEAFESLGDIEPSQRADSLSSSMNALTTLGGYLNILGLIIAVVSVAMWLRGRKKLRNHIQ